MNLFNAARKICESFTYDPGHSDLDNEQPIAIHCTLGDWRRLNSALMLAGQRADQPEGGWRTIDSAPKDGTDVLLCVWQEDGYGEIDVGSWGFIEKSDWYGSDVIGWLSNYGRIEEPTHWMPLPSSPMNVQRFPEGEPEDGPFR